MRLSVSTAVVAIFCAHLALAQPRVYVSRVAPDLHGLRVIRRYESAYRGYLVEAEPEVAASIEMTYGPGTIHEDAPLDRLSVQSLPSDDSLRHLDLLDSPQGRLDLKFAYDLDGTGVDIHIIDQDFYAEHAEFGGRLSTTFVGPRAANDSSCATGVHGTAIASVAAGATYGVAKRATIRGYALADCSGAIGMGATLAALDEIARNRIRPGVVVASIGSLSVYPPLDEAFDAVVAAGYPVIVAAGNDPSKGCGGSPVVNGSRVFAVGAVDWIMRISDRTTRGPCVRAYAMGEEVLAAAPGAPTASQRMSGSSIAAPIAAGVAATVLQASPQATPEDVYSELERLGRQSILRAARADDRNLLIGSVPARAPPTPSPAAPAPTPSPIAPDPARRAEGGVPSSSETPATANAPVAAIAGASAGGGALIVAAALVAIFYIRKRPAGATASDTPIDVRVIEDV